MTDLLENINKTSFETKLNYNILFQKVKMNFNFDEKKIVCSTEINLSTLKKSIKQIKINFRGHKIKKITINNVNYLNSDSFYVNTPFYHIITRLCMEITLIQILSTAI